MGVHVHPGTMDEGLTPICNECMIALCWDISLIEYNENKDFWDAWVCQDCNGGQKFNKKLFNEIRTTD